MARSSLGLLHVIFRKFVPKLWPMIYAEISFPLNILRTDFFSPNFIYAFILTRSILGFLHVIFRTFVPESWPLIYTKKLFPFNILRRNGHNFTIFYTCIHIDKIYLWIVAHHFLHICTRVMALDLLQNFVSAQYLENKWTDFDPILCYYLY